MLPSSEVLCMMLRCEQRNTKQIYYHTNIEEIRKKQKLRYATNKILNAGKRYPCGCCNVSFTTNSSLTRHCLTKKHHQCLITKINHCS
jgi:hypothetical protein